MTSRFMSLAVVLVLGLVAARVQAAPLNLTVPHDPLVLCDAVYVEYTVTGATGHLHAQGYPSQWNQTPLVENVILNSGDFTLDVDVDPATGQFMAGTAVLSLTASQPPSDPNPPMLYYSTAVSEMGYTEDDALQAILEFRFVSDGTGQWAPLPSSIGVVLKTAGVFGSPSLFASDFTDFYTTQADIFTSPVPEPATAGLLIIAMAGLLLRRRATT